jgi:hypothetical protein
VTSHRIVIQTSQERRETLSRFDTDLTSSLLVANMSDFVRIQLPIDALYGLTSR